jgi:TatD DNase family protein
MSAPVYEYVDTHVHLDMVYRRIKKPLSWPFSEYVKTFPPGFSGCLTVFLGSFEGVLNFIDQSDSQVYGAVGIHPHNAIAYNDEMEECLKDHLANPRIIALGETGLDYHYDNSPRPVQRTVFERQCRLAVNLGKPIVVHTREAEQDTLDILEQTVPKDHKFHIHCYTDTFWLCEQVLAKWPNAYFGFTGVITFPKARDVQDVCARVPLERMLSETDGPFMAPVPFRGRPSNPGYIPAIVKKMAELHHVDDETAFRTIRQNCRDLYGF